jgi:hypothetical protein
VRLKRQNWNAGKDAWCEWIIDRPFNRIRCSSCFMHLLENLRLLQDISCFLRKRTSANALWFLSFFFFVFLLLYCIIWGCIISGIKARIRLNVAKLNLRKPKETHEKQKEEKVYKKNSNQIYVVNDYNFKLWREIGRTLQFRCNSVAITNSVHRDTLSVSYLCNNRDNNE